jgi:phosphosulfolactate phosphohydrolase-like enzyme
MKAEGARCVVYGSILNAKAIANWIDLQGQNTTLLAAGEVDAKRLPFMKEREKSLANGNKIFALEDLLGAGAIAYFTKIKESEDCQAAKRLFESAKDRLLEELKETASHGYNETRGRLADTVYYSQLNLYDVIPRLHVVNGALEITAD